MTTGLITEIRSSRLIAALVNPWVWVVEFKRVMS